jgi:Arc/MetJ-type ribon-helix-helix transcriptional regulator
MSGSSSKSTISVSLPTEMIDWLDASTKSQSLPNQSKAVRCCINCIALGDVKMISIDVDDDDDGGGDESNNNASKSSSYCYADYRAVNIELATEQVKWIDSIITRDSGTTTTTTTTTTTIFSNQSEVVRSVIKACMKADEDVVFGVIRCKSKVTTCDGAKEAIELLSKRYGENNVIVKEEIRLL